MGVRYLPPAPRGWISRLIEVACRASLLVALAAFGLINVPAHACVVLDAFDINEARNADAIVVGRISNFGLAKSRFNESHEYAVFDLGVQQSISGISPKNITVIWSATTNTKPSDLSGQTALIALGKNEKSDLIQQGYRLSVKSDTRVAFFQSPCAHAFILRPSDENVSAVARVLKGEHVDQRTLKGPLFLEPSASTPEQPKSHWTAISAALAALLFAGFLGVSLIRGKKSKAK